MNKYLEKVASLGSAAESLRGFGKDFREGWRQSSTTSKIGLGMSASGLGLGAANYKNGVENKRNNFKRNAMEQESLNELKGISNSLKKKQHVTVNLKVDHQKEASLKDAVGDVYHFAKRNPLTAAGAVIGSADGALSTTKRNNESVVRAGIRGVRNTVTGGLAGAAVGSVGDHLRNKYLR